MYRLKCFVLWLVASFFLSNIYAQGNQSSFSRCDVDSIGDLWIFTLDKTGSMLLEKTVTGAIKPWTPMQIKDDVIRKLSDKGGVLDQINYFCDRVIIMETGYGDKSRESDSYGYAFCAAASLDSSFIHIVRPIQKFNTKGKSGLKSVLSDLLGKSNYNYRESFVSQIRVLSLHRLVKLIRQKKMGLTFRKIHIVTITDDADVNDQWKMDYYTIKRDPQKMRQLNELHSRYVYSSFTQKGGGYLDECEEFTDISSKNHIYVYNYVTRQQRVDDIICREDSIIDLAPLDGKRLEFQLNQSQIASDSICFAYIDTIIINRSEYPIGQYMNENHILNMAYDMNPVHNEIIIRGKLQVQYVDSIYGNHYKSYNFIQYNGDYTASIHTLLDSVATILIVLFLLFLIYAIFIFPNRKLLVINESSGQSVRVRRGYRWQWDKLNPLAYCNGDKVVFAKHACFKRRQVQPVKTPNFSISNCIVIDSPVPLTFSGNVLSDTTKNNISRNAKDSYGKYPEEVLQIYAKTWAGRIVSLQNNRFRWVRKKLYPVLNRFIFRISPHYYYWGNAMEGLISSPRLRGCHFLLEYKREMANLTYDDRWLNTYYLGDFPEADVLVCLSNASDYAVWDVYQLVSRKFLGSGISSAKHLIHFRQKSAMTGELPDIKDCLKKAIRREMRVNRIVFLDAVNCNRDGAHFNVTEASCMAYVCLVENTVDEKCQILYSPLAEADSTEKNIVIGSSSVSRLIWTSLVPFTSKKDRPSGDVAGCESLDIVREGASCQKILYLKHESIIFDNIRIKLERIK